MPRKNFKANNAITRINARALLDILKIEVGSILLLPAWGGVLGHFFYLLAREKPAAKHLPAALSLSQVGGCGATKAVPGDLNREGIPKGL